MSLRPQTFNDIIGQSDTVKRLKISAFGCKNTNEALPHVLIDGPPGLGKTTIATAIANEIGVNLYTINAANIRNVKSIMPYLMGMTLKSILFIDEIHRLPKIVEEFLYPVMEDFKMDILIEDNPESIDIPAFTIVGATTSGGSLSQPFYDRFLIKEHLSFYKTEELAELAKLNCKKIGINISEDELIGIAKRSKGTPRILNARIKWYKDYTSFYPDAQDINTIFESQGIDENGFDQNDKKYISVLQKNKNNPLGIKALSNLTGIAMETIENSIEPYMIRKGYVIRTQRGRIIGNIN